MFKFYCFLSIGLADYLRKVWGPRAGQTATQDDRQWSPYFDCCTGVLKPSVYSITQFQILHPKKSLNNLSSMYFLYILRCFPLYYSNSYNRLIKCSLSMTDPQKMYDDMFQLVPGETAKLNNRKEPYTRKTYTVKHRRIH